jgi:FKBP-type peptidyl-prolyl cis-trans isomerase 2
LVEGNGTASHIRSHRSTGHWAANAPVMTVVWARSFGSSRLNDEPTKLSIWKRSSRARKNQMAQAQNGDTVKVHYTGKLDDGTVFDSSIDREPLKFKLGDDQLISGFENAVVGMDTGESKTVKIAADEAYGPHRQEMVLVVNRDEFPDDIEPKVGEQLRMQDQDGREFRVKVTDTSEETVTLDGNHPLAGEDLTFDIQLVEVG